MEALLMTHYAKEPNTLYYYLKFQVLQKFNSKIQEIQKELTWPLIHLVCCTEELQ